MDIRQQERQEELPILMSDITVRNIGGQDINPLYVIQRGQHEEEDTTEEEDEAQ